MSTNLLLYETIDMMKHNTTMYFQDPWKRYIVYMCNEFSMIQVWSFTKLYFQVPVDLKICYM